MEKKIKKYWKQPDDDSVLLEEIIVIFQSNKNYNIFIGTDSHEKSTNCIFASVIALYEKGRGGRYFYQRHNVKNYKQKGLDTLRVRLMKEIEQSVMIAHEIRNLISFNTKITIHCDLNANPKFPSQQIQKEAEAYIRGMGFIPEVKPDSWASSSLADSHTR